MTDKDLVKGCIKQDRRSQKALYQSYAPYAYSVAKSYIKDTNLIQDIMQESFTSIFKSIDKFDSSKGNLKSWIAKIVTYRAIDFLKLYKKISIDHALNVVDDIVEEDFAYLDNYTKGDIEALLKHMPSGYRTIFLLSAIDEYSHVEIGEMLDITATTSRSQYHRSLKWIKKHISLTPNCITNEAL